MAAVRSNCRIVRVRSKATGQFMRRTPDVKAALSRIVEGMDPEVRERAVERGMTR